MTFEWDEEKNQTNIVKHGISFEFAKLVFFDNNRLFERDNVHSTETEERFFCYGKVGDLVVTVRFTLREESIRIIGAAHWRKGAKRYYAR